MYRFEHFGQFTRNDHAATGAKHAGHVGNGLVHAVRRLVEHQQVRQCLKGLKLAPPCRRLLRQKTEKKKMRRGAARGRQRTQCRVGAWQGDHRIAGIAHRRDRQRARVGNRRRAGIADQRDGFSRRQQVDQFLRSVPLVVLVQRQQPRGNAVVPEQMRGDARVLGGDDIDALEHVERAQGDVRQITNGRRDYI